MLSSIKERLDHKDDEGFTLIELMVVVLIIAILLAIAIPTFLGARNTANARAAQSNLRNALTAEQTEWTNTQAFSTDSATMKGIEASLSWTTGASTDQGTISVSGSTPATGASDWQVVVLSALGKDGNCWSIAQVNEPNPTAPLVDGTYYQKSSGSSCTASGITVPAGAPTAGSAASSTGSGWYTSF